MVDPADSKSAVRKDVRVRLSPQAQKDLENPKKFLIFVLKFIVIVLIGLCFGLLQVWIKPKCVIENLVFVLLITRGIKGLLRFKHNT